MDEIESYKGQLSCFGHDLEEEEMQSEFYEHRKRRENGKEIIELKLARIERAVNLMDVKLTEALRILESYGEKL